MEDKYYLFEPITAYREWKIILDSSNNFRLSGISNQNCVWNNKINIAKCNMIFSHGHKRHKAPDFNCDCGFWGYKRQIDLILAMQGNFIITDMLPSNFFIGGVVEFIGTVIEHENGYRAEKAKIKKLLWCYDKNSYNFNIETIEGISTDNFSIIPKLQDLTTREEIPQQIWTYLKSNCISSKAFIKDEIIKSLQDYYDVEIEYYEDYFERKLNDSDRKTNKKN